MNYPNELNPIFEKIIECGGKPYLVGGCVRDYLLGQNPKDFDVEVYGLEEGLIGILKLFGEPKLVGESFGVFKMKVGEHEVDFSLPRRESKAGHGHKGFTVELDPQITTREGAGRRDYTINSVMYDVKEQNIIDHYGGVEDLDLLILRATTDHFSEDPLRVLRGMQFAGRFNMYADHRTKCLCQDLLFEYVSLPKERVWMEWYKWGEKAEVPSAGLDFLREAGWLGLYPPLAWLVNCPQDAIHHPEGNVWEHTCFVTDEMVAICNRDGIAGEDRVVLMLAALLHDIGKPETTTRGDDGRWKSPGHAEAGVPIAREFLESIGAWPRIIERVIPLIQCHMIGCTPLRDVGPRLVRRLMVRLKPESLDNLARVMEADYSGRPPLPKGTSESAKKILEVSRNLNIPDNTIKPILMGRHLLEHGWTPCPDLGRALRAAFEAQLDGAFDTVEDAYEWVCNNHAQPSTSERKFAK